MQSINSQNKNEEKYKTIYWDKKHSRLTRTRGWARKNCQGLIWACKSKRF